MNWQKYIVSDKEVLLGKPAIKGTRISVEHIAGLFAQGWTEKEILMIVCNAIILAAVKK